MEDFGDMGVADDDDDGGGGGEQDFGGGFFSDPLGYVADKAKGLMSNPLGMMSMVPGPIGAIAGLANLAQQTGMFADKDGDGMIDDGPFAGLSVEHSYPGDEGYGGMTAAEQAAMGGGGEENNSSGAKKAAEKEKEKAAAPPKAKGLGDLDKPFDVTNRSGRTMTLDEARRITRAGLRTAALARAEREQREARRYG